MHTEEDNYRFLTEEPVDKVVVAMAVPTIISMLVTSIYNIVDTFFVGQINTQSTAAVGIVFSIMFIAQAFGFFFGHGSGNYISRELGAKRHQNAVVMAIELPDGQLVTGKTSLLLGASASALLNALKVLGGINDELHLIPPVVIEPLSRLKTQELGGHNPRLHADEVLIYAIYTYAQDSERILSVNFVTLLMSREEYIDYCRSGDSYRRFFFVKGKQNE